MGLDRWQAIKNIDLGLIFAIIAFSLCFIGLGIITYGLAVKTQLFTTGFEFVLCGVIIGVINAVLIACGVFGKSLN